METTQSLLAGYKIKESAKSRRTERGDLLDFFYEKVKPSYDEYQTSKGSKRTMTKSQMANLLSIFSVQQLYFLRIKCDEAKNFVSLFWYYVRPKK